MFLTSTLDGGEQSPSCSSIFTPDERALHTHCIGVGWVTELVWMSS